jgi:N-acetylmuramoyl-L-alanine amidase
VYKQQQMAVPAADPGKEPAAADQSGGDKPIIVVDPGHGGIDNGARGGGGVMEKDVTLAFGKALGKLLEASGHYRVVYTRGDDSYISLGERVAVARRNNADLFVSIHANSFPGDSVRGAIVYTASDKASDKMAAALADTENESDALAGIDVNAADSNDVMSILNDLTLRETRNFGVVFARNLVKELGRSTRMFKVPHQEASFKVLEAPDVPSALIELGYLTNPNDAKLMVTEAWQDKTAGSIVKAIDGYFSTRVAGQAGN